MSMTKLFPVLLVTVIAIVSIHCVAEPTKPVPATQAVKAQTQPASPMMGGHGGMMGHMMMGRHSDGPAAKPGEPEGPKVGWRGGMTGRFGPFMQGRPEMAGKMGPQFAMERREQLKDLLTDSESIGLMAIAAIRDEDKLSPQDKCKHLEELLEDTGTLEFRNAIHLALKDLYKKDGKIEKSIEHLKALVTENDEALQSQDEDDQDNMDDNDADNGREHGDREHGDSERGHGDREKGGHEGHEGHDKGMTNDHEKDHAKGHDKDKGKEKDDDK